MAGIKKRYAACHATQLQSNELTELVVPSSAPALPGKSSPTPQNSMLASVLVLDR
jgi:hypothetical protein